MQILSPPSPRDRVGFLVPRWNSSPQPYRQGIPFRCLPVAGALLRTGHEVVFCDQEPDLDRGGSAAALRDALHGCRGVLFWNQDLDPGVQAPNLIRWAARIKAWYPELPIAAGGGFLSVCPPGMLAFDGPVDLFLRGYGEAAAPALFAALRGEAPFDEVSGLVWRDAGGIRHNPLPRAQRFRPEDLEAYRLLDLARYRLEGGIFGNGLATFNVGTGQGCVKRCTFCYWRNHPPSLLGAAAIVELVAWLRRRYGVRQYHLAELDFFTCRRRVLELADRWREQVPDCVWFALASPADAIRFTPDDWGRLAAGGCRKLELGSESGSAARLRAMGKHHAPDAPLRLTRTLLAHGIVPMHNFVFGLPGETEEDRQLTLQLIARIRAVDPARVHLTFRLYQPCWDTPMGEIALARSPAPLDTLADVLAFRAECGAEGTRTMAWLDEEDELKVKRLVRYYLPLVTSQLVLPHGWQRLAYRALRTTAALRLRRRSFGAGVDRWLYQRLVRRPLDDTLVCGAA